MRRLACFVLLLGSGVGLHAQQAAGATPEPLTSDRPGVTDTVNVLPSGLLQLESGFSWSSRSEGNSLDRTFIGGSPLFRLGIGHRLELRFGGDGFRHYSHRAGQESEYAAGASDFSVGAKLALVWEHRFRPAVSLISMTSLPVGDSRFTSSGVDPTLKLAWSKALGEGTAVSGNFNVSSLSDPSGRFWQRAMSGRLDRDVWHKLVGFWEAYLVTPVTRSGDGVWTFDTGVSHPLGHNAQLDVSVGQQIVPLARCWFAGAGLVFRHPAWLARRP
jgi:hypothetical protein